VSPNHRIVLDMAPKSKSKPKAVAKPKAASKPKAVSKSDAMAKLASQRQLELHSYMRPGPCCGDVRVAAPASPLSAPGAIERALADHIPDLDVFKATGLDVPDLVVFNATGTVLTHA
jgi:hypothetical protein